MAFRFVEDGHPEADDYSSNYEWLDTEVRAQEEKPDKRMRRRQRCLDFARQWNRRKRLNWLKRMCA